MNLSANFCCENSVTRESKTPALCLVCGLMVCSQSHCCETVIGDTQIIDREFYLTELLNFSDGHKCGGCTSHARECGADVGIFLRIRECIIVIHSKVTRGEEIDKMDNTGDMTHLYF